MMCNNEYDILTQRKETTARQQDDTTYREM